MNLRKAGVLLKIILLVEEVTLVADLNPKVVVAPRYSPDSVATLFSAVIVIAPELARILPEMNKGKSVLLAPIAVPDLPLI